MRSTLAETIRASRVLAAAWVPPPAEGPDVCPICRGWRRPGYGVCFSCALVMGQVSHPSRAVSVISIYRPGGAMHRALSQYKNGPPTVRRTLAERLGALLSRHLWREGPGLAPGGWDHIAVVPSTTGRVGPHPLEEVLGGVEWLAGQVWSGLLGPGPDAERCGHRQAGDQAFRLTVAEGYPGGPARSYPLQGRRILLVEDTWTTGARAQSAASHLALAGAEVLGPVVIGRIVTPLPGAPTGDWWGRHGREAGCRRRAQG
jgi:predicted amidophosphoribosyltransferase